MSDDLIPLCEPSITGNASDYVRDCVQSGWVSSVGSYVTRFEEMMADAAGARFAIATTSGTAALHLAVLAAGIEAGDEVLVPDMTFIATVNAVAYVGAHPLFVAPGADDWHMNIDAIRAFLESGCERRGDALINIATGRPVRAILPAHLLGGAVDMDPLLALAEQYGLIVIEDAAEGLGTLYKGRKVGAMGRMGCFSFNGNKMITTGGGGMLTTDDEALAKRVRHLSTQAKSDAIEYAFDDVGYNYRLTNLQAALGCAQMEVLGDHVAKKRAIAETYHRELADVPGLSLMPVPAHTDCSWWMYTVLIDPRAFGMDSRALLRALNAQKILSRPLWQPLHLSSIYAGSPVIGAADVSLNLFDRGLSLPCSVTLSDAQQARVINAIKGLAS